MKPAVAPYIARCYQSALLCLLAASPLFASPAHAQEADTPPAKPYFRCTDSEGLVQFSDRPCHGEQLKHAIDSALPQRKLQNDARVREEQAAIARMEAERQAEEAAVRQAQERQNRADRQIADRLQAERTGRNAKVTSVLPNGGCDQCRTPPIGDPAMGSPNTYWPGYMR